MSEIINPMGGEFSGDERRTGYFQDEWQTDWHLEELSQDLPPETHEVFFRRADLLKKQLYWLSIEMRHNYKHTGYTKSLGRLKSLPDSIDGYFGFLGDYWDKFSSCDESLSDSVFLSSYSLTGEFLEIPEAQLSYLARKSLLNLGKLTAKITELIGFASWLADGDKDDYTNESLHCMRLGALDRLRSGLEIDYSEQLDMDFQETCLGMGIEAMHDIVRDIVGSSFSETDVQALIHISKETAINSIYIWQTYTELIKYFFDILHITDYPDMPKPGMSCNGVRVWRSASAEIL